MTSGEILYLAENDVAQCLTVREAIHLAEIGAKADGDGLVAGDKFYMAVGEQGFIKPFSGFLAGEALAYVKTFSFFVGNRALGLPVTDSMVILFDSASGLPVCIMQAKWITALKTGASTAVTARHLARRDSRILTIFGAGELGQTHLACFNELFKLDEVRIVDVIPGKAESLANKMRMESGIAVTNPPSPEDAIREADMIVTVTTGNAVNVNHTWLKPGTFIARMGSFQEVDQDLLLQADKLIVDRWAYVKDRVPEIRQLVQDGRLRKEDIYAEWPSIAAGIIPGRESSEEIILYIGLGIWGEYAAILPAVYRRAKELGLGTTLPA